MELRKICSIALLCAVAGSAIAVPARRGGFVRTAEDGTEKVVFQHGDETFHYITDENGQWLDDNTLQPLSSEAKAAKMRAKGESRLAKARRIKEETGTDRLLAPRGVVILVSFSDKAFRQTNEAMTQWAMGDTYTYNGATGSIRRYFLDQSWGAYDMQIDVVGPVTVSNTVNYYGANDAWDNDQHPDEMVVEACQLAAEQGIDFSKYDVNEDGEVDWVVVLYAGKGEASGGDANTIWPHQYDLAYTGADFKLNGKWVNHYCCLNELDGYGKREGIGTFCHEFSHVMGLPDFYATNNATHHTMCDWDIMDYGPYNNNGNTPPAYSAYERWFMGWMKPRLVNEASSVILPPLNETIGAACFMTENGADIDNILAPNPKTFYIFENRQKTGNDTPWDNYLPGSGMLITKISWSKGKWEDNTVNNYASAMGVDILEAVANTTTGYSAKGKATDLYPAGATEFTKMTNYQVTDIEMNNRIITFNVNGGGQDVNLDVESVQPSAVSVQKIVEDGKVIILRDGQKFDILGNRL